MSSSLQSAIPFVSDPAPVVPVVRLEGVIGRAGRFSRGLSLAGVAPTLERAFGVKRAVGVALAINSPGGSPVQSRLIHDRIRVLAEEKGRRVFVFCEDVAASGGYMLACAGDEIYADPSSLVGSIGVVGAGFGLHEAIAKLGVERRVYTAGRNKVRLDPFRPETDDDRAFVAKIQKSIHDEFIALVKSRRGPKLNKAESLFEGDVFVARDAVASGLIDGLGHMREVMRSRYGPRVRLKPIRPPRAPLGAGLVGAGVEALADVLEDRHLRARLGL